MAVAIILHYLMLRNKTDKKQVNIDPY